MDPAESPVEPHPVVPSLPLGLPSGLPRGLALATLAALLTFIGATVHSLWSEWSELQHELARARNTAVIGYPGIEPRLSYAAKPKDWYRREGDALLLWSGWVDGQGHSWFRLAPGDLDPTQISGPMGRDVTQPIDHPLVENGGGTIWSRVPDEALVFGGRLAGVATAYPMLVLDKVTVINDEIGGKPLLIAYTPFVNAADKVLVFEPVVAGRRVTMGLSGYFHAHRPVLYDRGTESLWVQRDGGLTAVSGKHKGTTLKALSKPETMPFGRWKAEHPEGRLVVGANRVGPRPAL